MERAIHDLCAKHSLNAASVSVDAIYEKTSVFLHWSDPQDQCAYGIAGTYKAALKEALSNMKQKRGATRKRIVRPDRHVADSEIPF